MAITGKIVLITGISKGIGKAVSLELLDRGCIVIGWGMNAPDFQHMNLRFIKCDVSSELEVEKAWTETYSEYPVIDFLINNAGLGYFSPIEDFSFEKWKQMLDVNLTGMFLVTKKVVPVMKKRLSGHILNISSIAGKTGAPQGEGYNATKYGVAGFSESLFLELRPFRIKVTTLFPGAVQTHFFDEIPGVQVHENMLRPEDIAQSIAHILDSPPNYLIREMDIRPLDSKPPVK